MKRRAAERKREQVEETVERERWQREYSVRESCHVTKACDSSRTTPVYPLQIAMFGLCSEVIQASAGRRRHCVVGPSLGVHV